MLDLYHSNNYVPEIWSSSGFKTHSGINYDIHDPYTDAYVKKFMATNSGYGGLAPAHPSNKQELMLI